MDDNWGHGYMRYNDGGFRHGWNSNRGNDYRSNVYGWLMTRSYHILSNRVFSCYKRFRQIVLRRIIIKVIMLATEPLCSNNSR